MLKPDRDYQAITDISHFWSDAQLTAERGGVASLVTGGSGVSLDDTANVVDYAADPSGAVPKGVLCQDIVDVDTEKFHINFYKNETLAGEKVTLIRKGWIVTNKIGGTPSAGGKAYLWPSGVIGATTSPSFASPVVGKFETSKDADGYAKVYVDL